VINIRAALTVNQFDKADATYYFAYLLAAWQRPTTSTTTRRPDNGT
jgi:hypothetical protein